MNNLSCIQNLLENKNEELPKVLKKIGDFYLEDSKGDVRKAIRNLEVDDITVVDLIDNKIVIATTRPGRFIGPKGERVKRLEDYLGKTIYIKEVETVNTFIVDYLLRPTQEMAEFIHDMTDIFANSIENRSNQED